MLKKISLFYLFNVLILFSYTLLATTPKVPLVFDLTWGMKGTEPSQFQEPASLAIDNLGHIYVTDTLNHRVQKFDSNGEFITQWGIFGSNQGQFNQPTGIAIGSNNYVYVVDSQNHRFQLFDSDGQFIQMWGMPGTGDIQFNQPSSVAIDKTGSIYITDSQNHRVQKIDNEGNLLLQWGNQGSEIGQFQEPKGIAIDNNQEYVYVVDFGNHRLQKFNFQGNFLKVWGEPGLAAGQFQYPQSVVVDNLGYVYVMDTDNHRIQKFDSDGQFLTQWGAVGVGEGQWNLARGIAINTAGIVYVADTKNHRIQKWMPLPPVFQFQWGTAGTGEGQFKNPYGIAIDEKQSDVYITDYNNNRLQKFAQLGSFLNQYGSVGTGSDKFHNPAGIAIDKAGFLYVADRGNHRIQKLNSEGDFIKTWGEVGQDPGKLNEPRDVAIDSGGNIYVVDWNNHRVQKFNNQGNFIKTWGEFGSQSGQFNLPRSIAIDENDNIYVVDTNNKRIQKFNSAGEFLLQWGKAAAPSLSPKDGEFHQPYGISIDNQSHVYVTDAQDNRIQQFDLEGNFLTKWGSLGEQAGQFSEPADIAVDDGGNVYITDYNNNRIQVFGIHSNQAPVNHLPSQVLSLDEDQTLVFATTHNNLISISDEDAGNQIIKVTLTATEGTLTLNGTAGLHFSEGDGMADVSMTFTGNLLSVNSVLNGMQLTPLPNYYGEVSIQIMTDDQGYTGAGGIKSTTDTLKIKIKPVADTPQVTQASTDEGVQTTTGLTISRHPDDGQEVVYFKITAIKNGLLFQHDGTTPIQVGEFISVEQGEAGLKFTPTATNNGQFQVQAALTNDDTGLGDEPATVIINVGSINDAPVLKSIGNQTIKLGDLLTFTASATDPDIPPNQLKFSLIDAPPDAFIDSATGQFTWKPSQAGQFTFTVVVTDDGVNPDKLSDSEEITVIVGNSPPVLNSIATQTIALGQSMTFMASATDAENKMLFFSLQDEPPGATINPTTGQFTWSPTQPGTFITTVIVTDTGGLTARQTVTLVVGNTPPQLAPIAKQLVHLGTTVTLQATATDAENNELRFSLEQAPVGAVIDPLTGLLTWTPTQNGIFNFRLVVTDSSGSRDQQAVTITVTEQPILAPIGNQTIFVNQLLTFTAQATHPGSTPLTFSLDNAPVGAVIDSETGVFMWIPKQQGIFNTTVIVMDVNQNRVSKNFTITVTAALTQLSLKLDSNQLFKGDTLTVTGVLYRFPSNNLGLNNNSIQLSITSPDNQVVTLETLTQSRGQYLFDNLPPLTQPGQYVLQTQFQGTDNLNSSQSIVKTVRVRDLAGYAMLIQGKSEDGSGLEAHNKTLNRIYRILKWREFTDENIEYFNHNPNQSALNIVIDNIPTLSRFQTGLNDLQTQLNAKPAPFYLILVDHSSSKGVFYLNDNPHEIITATDLDNGLTQLEQGLNPQALEQPRIIMIGSCYSGSFLSTLAKKGRVIITSTAANEESHQGPKEPDEIRSGEFFIEALFAQLGRGLSLKAAFELATQSTETFTLIAPDAPFNRFYQDRAIQHPLLEDNADRQGSNVLFVGQDGEVAKNIYLGTGRQYDATAPDNPADIISVTPPIYLEPSVTTAQLVVTVNNPDRVQNQQVAVDIRSPSLFRHRTGIENKEQLELNELTRLYLSARETDHFMGSFNAFNEPGQYEIYYWVTDTETGQLSPLKRSLVYKRKAGNYPPRSFSLLSPKTDSQTSTTVIFDWNDTTDPEGERITYTFLLATDPDFNQIVYRQDELLHSLTYISNYTPIHDDLNISPTGLRDDTQYYWQVTAVDPFGEKNSSPVSSFQTNNTNAPPSILSLQLFNAVQFFSLETADLSFWQMDEWGNLIMDERGNPIPVTQPPTLYQEQNDYLMLLPQGRRRLKINSPDLETQAINLDTTTDQLQLVLPNAPEIKFDPVAEANSLKLKMKPVATPEKNPGQLQFTVTATEIQENQINVNLLVERVIGQDGEVAVAFTTINGTALAGNDYQSASGTLNWADQDNRSQRINLTINNDSEFERDETFSISLSNPTGEATLGINRLMVTIKDDDIPASRSSDAGILQFSSATATLSEIDGSVNSIMINRSGGNKGTVSVQYLATDEGNATRGQDYLIENNTLTWNAGDTQSKPLAIKIVNDDKSEPLETIYLSLSNPTGGATLGALSQCILTIQDDDIEDNAISSDSTTPSESVVLNTPTQINLPVADPEITTAPTNSTPNPETTTELTNSILDPEMPAESTDSIINPETTTEPTNSTPDPETTVEPTSPDQNGTANASLLQFTQYFYEVSEGDDKLTNLLVSRSGDSTGEASVKYTISPDSEAKETEDFIVGSGTLHWSDGETTAKAVDLQLLEDNQIEPDEKIFIYLSDPKGAQLGQPNMITIVVIDNDAESSLQFSKSIYTVTEGQGDLTEIIQVIRKGNFTDPVSVEYTIRNDKSTAWLKQDYLAMTGQLEWDQQDDTPKGIPIYLIDDNQVEDTETIVLQLGNPIGAQLGSQNQAQIIIEDNDKQIPVEALQPGILQFTSPIYSVVEGSQAIAICVERILGYQGEVTAKYQVTNRSTAIENMDYILLQKEPLHWLPEEKMTIKCLNFNSNADDLDESFELIHLQLTEVTGGVQLGDWAETQILLLDPQVEESHSRITEEALPDLGQSIALAAENSQTGQSHFRGGIFLHNAYHNPLTLSTTQPVRISGQINIDPLHVGQTADIVIVARWTSLAGEEKYFMQNSNGQIQSWDLNFAHLVAAQEQVTLSAIQAVDIYTGLLNVGQFQIFFGYRLADKTLFFNGKQPILVTSYQ